MESFKKRYKNKRFNLTILCAIIITFCIILLTFGYSAFNASLDINNIIALIRAHADIRVTNVVAINSTNGASSNYEDYNVSSITSAITLPNQNSMITYHIEVTNIGNVKQGIYAIDENYKIINSNIDSNLEIKSKTVNLKESLCDDNNSNKCKLNSITTFDITIGYKNNGYDGTNTTHLVELGFDFRRMFDITYNGFANTSGLPTEMIYGDTKAITFDNNSSIPTNVFVTGATGNYSSPTLTLTNVIDNVTINNAYSVTYVDFTGSTNGLTSTIPATGGTITFNNTTGIPESVTVSGATGNYSSPNLVLSNITGNVIITAIFNSNVEIINNEDGSVTTITTTENQNGSTTVIAVTTDQNGNTLSETETTNNTNGSAVSTTINYDLNHNPTSGSTSTIDTSGNINTQEVVYDSNGNTHVSGYTIDTAGNANGGETVASLDTGLIVFDGQGFEMTLVFKCNMSENIGNNIFGAIQRVNNKYAGFNLAIPSSAKVNMYAGKNSSLYSSGAIGSNIHSGSQYWSISSSDNSKVTQYTLHMTYLPKSYGTNTNNKYGWISVSLTPVQTSGNQYYQQNPLEKVNQNIPENLSEATFTIGGNGLNNTYDMVGFEVISFDIHKV